MAQKKLLVVDDEISVRTILRQILEKSDFKVGTAGDGVEAFEMLQQEPFDVVITDINMPNMDGVALLKKIKETFPALPVIFITAFGRDKIVVEAMKMGLVDFIEKPFRMDAVLETINRIMKRKG